MLVRALATAAALTLALSGCVANQAGGATVDVDITDDTCTVSPASAKSGSVTFRLSNSGTDVNEFYILSEDLERVVGEKEDLAPGQTVTYTTNLEAGTYSTACKFREAGDLVGTAEFTVSD